MERKTQSATSISVFSIPELVTLIVNNLITSPRTIFNIACVSKWHNQLVWSDDLWKPFRIIANNNLRSEPFRIRLFLAQQEEELLEKRLAEIRKIKGIATIAAKKAIAQPDLPLPPVPKGPKDIEKAIKKLLQKKPSSKLIYWLECLKKWTDLYLPGYYPDQNKMKYLAECGIIPKLIELLTHRKKEAQILAFAIILNVACSETHCTVTFNEEFVQMIVKRFQKENEEFQNEQKIINRALKSMSAKQEGTLLLVKNDVLSKLLARPETYFDEGDSCSIILQDIVHQVVKANKAEMLIPYFHHLLRVMAIELKQDIDGLLTGHTLTLIATILHVGKSSDLGQAIIDLELVPPLMKVCQQRNYFAVKKALEVLEPMLIYSNQSQCEYLEKNELVNVIQQLLGWTTVNPLVNVADVIPLIAGNMTYHLMKHCKAEKEIPLMQQMIKRVLELKKASAGPKFCKSAAKNLLDICQEAGKAAKIEFIKQGVFDDILTLLELNDPYVLEAAILAMTTFFKDNDSTDDNFNVIKRAEDYGIVASLKSISEKFADETKLQEAIIKCLNYLKPNADGDINISGNIIRINK